MIKELFKLLALLACILFVGIFFRNPEVIFHLKEVFTLIAVTLILATVGGAGLLAGLWLVVSTMPVNDTGAESEEE